MSYTREWTPTNVNITQSSVVTIASWDNSPVPGASYFISANAVVVTVDKPNKYKITVRNGPAQETTKLFIPERTDLTLETRLQRYIDEVIASTPSTPGGSVANIYPDTTPGNEGYFIFEATE